MSIFVNLSSSLVLEALEIFTLSSYKSDRKKNFANFFRDTLQKLIYQKLCKIQRISCQKRDFILI